VHYDESLSYNYQYCWNILLEQIPIFYLLKFGKYGTFVRGPTNRVGDAMLYSFPPFLPLYFWGDVAALRGIIYTTSTACPRYNQKYNNGRSRDIVSRYYVSLIFWDIGHKDVKAKIMS
jgi:hypothetical protein